MTRPGTFRVNHKTTGFVEGETNITKSRLTVDVKFINTTSDANRKVAAKDERNSGLSSAFTTSIYGIIQGATNLAAKDPAITTIRIKGSNVINSMLKDKLEEFGFKSTQMRDGTDFYIDIALHR